MFGFRFWVSGSHEDSSNPAEHIRTQQHCLFRAALGPGTPPAPQVHEGEDWAAFNERQRGDALTFAVSKPKEGLVLTTVALVPQHKMMTKFLDRSGQRWRQEQMVRAVHSGRIPSTPIFDSYSCRLTDIFSGGRPSSVGWLYVVGPSCGLADMASIVLGNCSRLPRCMRCARQVALPDAPVLSLGCLGRARAEHSHVHTTRI